MFFENFACTALNTKKNHLIHLSRFNIYNEEFDPGSGQTLAACLTHASQGEWVSSDSLVNWRKGE
jgi:hypothetical protein